MYDATVTIFNRYESNLGITWYPSVLTGVNLAIDKAAIASKYGPDSQDVALLNVKITSSENADILVGKKIWLPPKEWSGQLNDEILQYLTFASGQKFDFFWLGEWDGQEVIYDKDYGIKGFYDYMVKKHDYVFAVTSVSGPFTLIPHFEITGR